jgi:predicted nucleotidyltransferase
MQSKSEILEFLKRHKKDLENTYHIQKIGLFGSYARDEATSKSDIDFFVRFDQVKYDYVYQLKEFLSDSFQKSVDIVVDSKYIKERNLKIIKKDLIYV